MTRRQKSLSYFGEIEGREREARGRRGKKRKERINPADCFYKTSRFFNKQKADKEEGKKTHLLPPNPLL